jgi:hypothetical protein
MEFPLGEFQFIEEGAHRRLAVTPSSRAECCPGEPRIKIILQGVDGFVDLLAEGNAIELVEHALVQPLDDPVGLRRPMQSALPVRRMNTRVCASQCGTAFFHISCSYVESTRIGLSTAASAEVCMARSRRVAYATALAAGTTTFLCVNHPGYQSSSAALYHNDRPFKAGHAACR